MLHLFRFQVWGWRDPALPLWLPAGARLLSLQVNGLWIERVPQGKSEDGALRFDLPAPERHGPAESVLRRYKVVYETDRPSGWPLLRLEAPAPRLPLAPLILLRRWRLPPGMVPLHDGTVRALPSAAAEPDDRAEGQDLSSLSSLLLHPWTLSEGDERQRQQLTAAARGVRARAGRPLTLGEALERVACDLSAEPDHPLIVDSLALAEANLAPGRVLDMPADPTKDAAPFWESLDLVIVASRPAPLLTTRRRRDSWPTAGGETIPPSVEAAIAEAAANGHDTSGRFLWRSIGAARRGGAAPGRPGNSLRCHPARLDRVGAGGRQRRGQPTHCGAQRVHAGDRSGSGPGPARSPLAGTAAGARDALAAAAGLVGLGRRRTPVAAGLAA